ncbi:MAG: AAA family ATPase, partial [bacterium]|nr:AAA family ATPase [bacterium]
MAEEEIKDKEKNLEGGTYEIIRNRLTQQGKDLKKRLAQLNTARKDVFGSIENTLLGSERIITRNNCVPRDMAPVDHRFIFGYNVHMGLKTQIKVEDVFAMYEYKDRQFRELGLDIVKDKKFVTDFKELYKYYKLTRLVKLAILEPYLYMIFQVGKDVSDIKAFKWLIQDGKISYVDNRSDHEVRFPPQHDFQWKRTRREQHRYGVHPHVSIDDRVFVEAVGGDLTIKVEDNTESGQGIYAEEVENKDQTLDDGEIYYAIVGNLILLKVKPYQEKDFRYFVFNEKLQHVTRIDTIKDACILLPDDHGLIFPNGYYLQSGEYKTFDIQLENMMFEQRIPSSNGEDFQYFFYNRETGVYLILSYNLISQTVETPIMCSGYTHFENGEMILFKAEDEPRKNHVIQIWQTPYVGRDFVGEAVSDSLLYKIGNQEVVRCMAQCQSVINLVRKEESYINLYVDIEKEASDILDSYFWIDKEEAFGLKAVVEKIRTTAASAVEEYEKVVRIKNATRKQIDGVKDKAAKLFKEVSYSSFEAVNDYVNALAQLRGLRGEIISLKDLRYTELPLVESLEEQVKEKNEELSGKCVEFLLQPEGLEPYRIKVEEQSKTIPGVQKGSEGKELGEEITQTSNDLELLIDIVSNLKIEDPTQTTEIIDRISTIYASLNQAKSKLSKRMKELRAV